MLRIVDWSEKGRQSKVVTEFLERSAFPEEAERAASEVLADIRARGDAAVAECVARFEGAKLTPARFRISQKELDGVDAAVPIDLKRAVKDAHRRVMRFSKESLRSAWTMKTPRGGSAGEFFSPMDRVGVYVGRHGSACVHFCDDGYACQGGRREGDCRLHPCRQDGRGESGASLCA